MSEPSEIVIVGGGPAALSAARAYREAGGSARVTMVAAEPHSPYLRPPLTKEFLRGELDAGELSIEAADWYGEHEVALVHARVNELDLGRRAVKTDKGEAISFEACVLATGSAPARLPVPGAEHPGVLTMRTLEDSVRLAELAQEDVRVIVIGSGFIGCEAAASVAMRGARPILVTDEEVPQERRLGPDAGARLAGWLEALGVDTRFGDGVASIERSPDGDFVVETQGGERVEAAAVLQAAGISPNLDLAEGAGLELAPEGGIAVDSGMRTSADGVFAVGDIACAHNPTAGRRLRVEHWGEALTHGQIAGSRLAGGDDVWDSAPGFWSTIGSHQLKYAAWGDGYDEARLVDHGGGAFTVWYGSGGMTVGVLTHESDEDYERGRQLVESAAPLPAS